MTRREFPESTPEMAHNATIYLDWGVFFMVQVAAEHAQAVLPPGQAPVEPAPGQALLSVNLVHFLAGGDGVDLPENWEVDVGVSVSPDNTCFAGQPQALSAVQSVNIASTSDSYLEHCVASGYRVHPHNGLCFDIHPDALAGRVYDADGTILAFAFRGVVPPFQPFQRIGQDVVNDERGEYRLNYVFDGEGFAPAHPDNFSLTLHGHPFFRGLPVAGTPQTCFGQSALRPGKRAALAFHGPAFDAAAANPVSVA